MNISKIIEMTDQQAQRIVMKIMKQMRMAMMKYNIPNKMVFFYTL